MNKEPAENSDSQVGSDRRDRPDRRAGNERRRSADVRVPIIHIAPSVLRVLVVVHRSGGQQDLAIARSIPWRLKAEELHSSEGAAELSAALTKLVSEERLSGAEAEVLLSSELCVTRAVSGVVDEVQRESNALRERSQSYLSLGPGKKMIAASSTPLDARHSHAMLTVATEKTLHIVSNAVESAGMELGAIRSAQVALSRTVHHVRGPDAGAALVIGVDDSCVELGIMSKGRLFLDYRPGGDTNVDQLADLLRQHHTRLQRYCHRHHGLDGEKLTQIVVSGESAEAERASASVKAIEHLQVSLLDITSVEMPWELRGDDLAPEMAPVVGSALALEDDDAHRGPNLVDQLANHSRPVLLPMLARKLSPVAAALVAAVVFGFMSWNAQHDLTAMQQQLSVVAPKAARANVLRRQLMSGHGEVQQLDKLAQNIPSQPYSQLLKILTRSIPADVWLSGLHIDGDQTASIAGSSYVESSIYDLVGHLQHLPGVSQVALQGTGIGRTAHRNATTFDIHFDLDFNGQAKEPKEAL